MIQWYNIHLVKNEQHKHSLLNHITNTNLSPNIVTKLSYMTSSGRRVIPLTRLDL